MRRVLAVLILLAAAAALAALLMDHPPPDDPPLAAQAAAPEIPFREGPAPVRATRSGPVSPIRQAEKTESDDVTAIFISYRNSMPEDESAASPASERLGAGRMPTFAITTREGFGRGSGETLTGSMTFIAGLNAGKRAECNGSDIAVFKDVYPGLGIIEYKPSSPDAPERAFVLVRSTAPVVAFSGVFYSHGARNLKFPITVTTNGRRPVADALVSFGKSTFRTDDQGIAVVGPCGDSMIVISAHGFETARALAPRGGWSVRGNSVGIRNGGSIRVHYPEPFEAREAPSFFLIPQRASRTQTYPIETTHVTSPIRQSSISYDGCPMDDDFVVLAFSESGAPTPAIGQIPAAPGEAGERAISFKFRWNWPVKGEFAAGDRPASGVRAWVETADYVRAAEGLLQSSGSVMDYVVPVLSCLKRPITVSQTGGFCVETYDIRRPAYLVVELDQNKQLVRRLRDGSTDFGTIDLSKYETRESGRIKLLFSENRERRVRLVVDGKEQPTRKLGADRAIFTPELQGGDYTVEVFGGSTSLLKSVVQLNQSAEVAVPDR